MLCPKCYTSLPNGETRCPCGFTGAPPPPPESPPAPPTPRQAENSARLGRILGLLLCGGVMAAGVLMTIASHDQAVNRGGGRYRIFTGLIAFGAIGMFRLLSGKK